MAGTENTQSVERATAMNCRKCKEMLSDLLDSALNETERASVSQHLQECLSCYTLHFELAAIVSFSREYRDGDDSPLDSKARWSRLQQSLADDLHSSSLTTDQGRSGAVGSKQPQHGHGVSRWFP